MPIIPPGAIELFPTTGCGVTLECTSFPVPADTNGFERLHLACGQARRKSCQVLPIASVPYIFLIVVKCPLTCRSAKTVTRETQCMQTDEASFVSRF